MSRPSLRFVALAAFSFSIAACGGGNSASLFDEPAPGDDAATDGGGSADAAPGEDATGEDATPAEDAMPSEDATPAEDATAEDATPVEDTSPAEDTAVPVDTGVVDAEPDATVACTEPGSKVFGGHCYFPIAPRSWVNARAACTGAGAHLVTIGSGEEQAVVQTLGLGGPGGSGDRWIGYYRPDGAPPSPSSFKWVTSEAVTYTHWLTGEPNGSGQCARMRSDGQWADYSCSQNFVAICERE